HGSGDSNAGDRGPLRTTQYSGRRNLVAPESCFSVYIKFWMKEGCVELLRLGFLRCPALALCIGNPLARFRAEYALFLGLACRRACLAFGSRRACGART